jgi:hypothetical protein
MRCTCEVHAYEVHACKIHVYEVHPLKRKKKNLKGEDNDKTGIRTLDLGFFLLIPLEQNIFYKMCPANFQLFYYVSQTMGLSWGAA